MPEPLIRRARPDEAETLAAIGRATFTETFGHLYPAEDLAGFLDEAHDLNAIRADLADAAKALWLVEADGQAVGYALAGGPCTLPHPQVTPDCGELKRIYVTQAWQGSGLALRLLSEVMAWLERDGPRPVWLGVWSENHRAQRFYARHGFTRIGEYGFKVGRTVDHEYILRREAVSFSTEHAKSASNEHNPA
jgi:ribosomal protein S18 acetylase RimI-like enzyme